jgi:methyltransferase (TIGR00027 family)
MKEMTPSSTARVVAQGVLYTACDSRLASLVPPGVAEASLRFIEPQNDRATMLLAKMRSGSYRALLGMMERITIPGIALHYVLRKRYLEEITRDALQSGFVQVVVIGAGFDSLAFRLHREYPETRFIEIDHPATQRAKQVGLQALGGIGENLRLVPLDLIRNNLGCALVESGVFDPAMPALFIAEGLTMYLPESEVASILRLVAGHGAASRIAFTFMDPRRDGALAFHNGTRIVDWWLRLKGEPFLWGIDRRALPGFLLANNLRMIAVANEETLRERYLRKKGWKNIPLAVGECICVAGHNS